MAIIVASFVATVWQLVARSVASLIRSRELPEFSRTSQPMSSFMSPLIAPPIVKSYELSDAIIAILKELLETAEWLLESFHK